MSSPQPPQWSADDLARQRTQAVDGFVAWWKQEGNVAYRAHYEAALRGVRALFDQTGDLLGFGAEAVVLRDRAVREVARYLAGPPLSDDDLEILAGAHDASGDRDAAFAGVVHSVLDTLRFPWLADPCRPRLPTVQERETAICWTAGLLAAQKAATERRNAVSRRQEQAVEDALVGAPLHFRKVAPRAISSVRDFLEPGEFCRQSSVGGTRADLTIGLRDRLLVIECKVSNSEVNSYKRLNHEVGDKASSWTRAFGRGVIPVAVLDGVFKLDNLLKAQDAGIAIFWERDLGPLTAFLQEAR